MDEKQKPTDRHRLAVKVIRPGATPTPGLPDSWKSAGERMDAVVELTLPVHAVAVRRRDGEGGPWAMYRDFRNLMSELNAQGVPNSRFPAHHRPLQIMDSFS